MKDGFILTRCECCDRIGMMYHQFMFSFSPLDFKAFNRYMEAMSFENNYSPFHDGVDRVVIETYHFDIQVTLKEEEFYRFKSCLQEAQIKLQIYDILKN